MGLPAGEMPQNRCRITSLLGQGGMGAVYHAWDTRFSVPITRKEMIPQPGPDPHTFNQLHRQLQKEAKVLAQTQVARWGQGDLGEVAFSPDGSLVASGSMDAVVRLWRWRRSE